jgi:hypothetical protein
MAGEFDGYGESVGVLQADPADLTYPPSILFDVTNHGWVKAIGSSLFVGDPWTHQIARFWGSTTSNGNSTEAGEYEVKDRGETLMAPVDAAMCYFTFITGRFRSLNDYASITSEVDSQGEERWVLRTGSQASPGDDDASMAGVTARARCFLFDQSQ